MAVVMAAEESVGQAALMENSPTLLLTMMLSSFVATSTWIALPCVQLAVLMTSTASASDVIEWVTFILFQAFPWFELLEEIVPLVINEDESREVLHGDLPDCFHAQFRIGYTFDACDAILGEHCGYATDST